MKLAKGMPVTEAEIRENTVCHNLTSSTELYGRSPIKLNSSRSSSAALAKVFLIWLINAVAVFLVV